MSIVIKELNGHSKTVDDVHYFTLKDGRSFLYYYDFSKNELHWADLYIIAGKYYKTYESSISNPYEFKRLWSRNVVNSKPLLGDVQEVSSEVIQNLMPSGNVIVSPLPSDNTLPSIGLKMLAMFGIMNILL